MIDAMLKGGIAGAGIGGASQVVQEGRAAMAVASAPGRQRNHRAWTKRSSPATTQPREPRLIRTPAPLTGADPPQRKRAASRATDRRHARCSAAGAAPKVAAETPQGVITGTVLDEQQDGDNLIATILGDDGQGPPVQQRRWRHHCPGGRARRPAVGRAGRRRRPRTTPTRRQRPRCRPGRPRQAGPVPLEGMSMEELKARIAYVNEQAQRNGGATNETMKERKRVEKQIKVLADHAIATSKPAEEPISMGPFDDNQGREQNVASRSRIDRPMHEVVEKDGKFTINRMRNRAMAKRMLWQKPRLSERAAVQLLYDLNLLTENDTCKTSTCAWRRANQCRRRCKRCWNCLMFAQCQPPTRSLH